MSCIKNPIIALLISKSFFIKTFILVVVIVITTAGEIKVCKEEEISKAIKSGDLSLARFIANDVVKNHPNCESDVSRLYVFESDNLLKREKNNDIDVVLSRDNMMVLEAKIDHKHCWSWNNNSTNKNSVFIPADLWDRCCSQLSLQDSPGLGLLSHHQLNNNNEMSCYRGNNRLCCDFFHGSSSYLHLPVLRELALRLRVKIEMSEVEEEIYNLQQDGFLRRYDTAGIFWPTAYLLSLCIASPEACGIPEIYLTKSNHRKQQPIAVELGAGIGVPSIVLARTLQRYYHQQMMQQRPTSTNNTTTTTKHPFVVATDKAPYALALTRANTHASKVSVATSHLDHFNLTSLMEFKKKYYKSEGEGFDIVLGSSLQALFNEETHDPNHHLWVVLDVLLHPSNPNAIAILAHTIKAIAPPTINSKFRLLRKINGDRFDMTTRFGESSDFEISVFARRVLTKDKESNLSTEL